MHGVTLSFFHFIKSMFENYHSYTAQMLHYPSYDGKMAYFDQGKGPCILLLHGVPTSSWLYRKIIPSLLKKGYRVIAPDMLGYGNSAKPVGYEVYSPENTGKRILELMRFLKIDSWTHVFHDGGGLWTWDMLQQDASKVSQLIMLNTIVYQEGFKPPMKFEKGIIAKFYSRLYSWKWSQGIVLNPTFKNGLDNNEVIDQEMLEGYKSPLLRDGHHSMYYFFTQTCKEIPDYAELHKSLDIPLSVIWGKSDDMLIWENMEAEIMSNFNLKKTDIHLIDGKHFIQEEQPELIGQIVLKVMGRSK